MSNVDDMMIDDEQQEEAKESDVVVLGSGSVVAEATPVERRNKPDENDGKFYIEDDDHQDGGKYPSLKEEDISNEARLDELLNNEPLDKQHTIMMNYLREGVYYPFVAQWRNPLISAIKENVIVKSVVQFNPFFGGVVIVEPIYEFDDHGNGSDGEDFASTKRKKKTKKTFVTDLTRTGYYAMVTDLFGLKKKSVIGRILDDH